MGLFGGQKWAYSVLKRTFMAGYSCENGGLTWSDPGTRCEIGGQKWAYSVLKRTFMAGYSCENGGLTWSDPGTRRTPARGT
jgi:hypothetical protein